MTKTKFLNLNLARARKKLNIKSTPKTKISNKVYKNKKINSTCSLDSNLMCPNTGVQFSERKIMGKIEIVHNINRHYHLFR